MQLNTLLTVVFAIVFVFDISAYNCNRNEIQYMYLTPCLESAQTFYTT